MTNALAARACSCSLSKGLWSTHSSSCSADMELRASRPFLWWGQGRSRCIFVARFELQHLGMKSNNLHTKATTAATTARRNHQYAYLFPFAHTQPDQKCRSTQPQFTYHCPWKLLFWVQNATNMHTFSLVFKPFCLWGHLPWSWFKSWQFAYQTKIVIYHQSLRAHHIMALVNSLGCFGLWKLPIRIPMKAKSLINMKLP